jgi:cysteine desulfurase
VTSAASTASSYFDAASGLPWHPVAVEALRAATEDGWADPNRLAGPSRRSAVLLDAAREATAAELDVRPDELVFLPSGAQALQWAVLGTLAGRSRVGRRLLHSAVEHSTVFAAAEWHVAHGGEAETIPVDARGRVDPDQFRTRAAGAAAAVLQAANHEVGTRQPVSELHLGDVPLVVDASHDLVFGSAPPNAAVFTGDARLWGAPSVGLLVIKTGTRWLPPFPVDDSERRRGVGTPNVPAIVAAAASLRATRQDREEQARRLTGYVDQLRRRLPELVPDTVVLGDARERLPHLVTFSSAYLDGEALLTQLDRHGFSVSSGSSCTSDTLAPSHVLVAMGALTSGNVRISLHRDVQQADIDRFLTVLPGVVAEVRAGMPAARPATASADSAPVVDSRGRRCPLPILDLARALPGIAIGSELTVLADDPAAASDIAAWCRMSRQLLVSADPVAGYRVRRLR